MESLPDELLENILTYLSYPEQGRLLTVSRRWNRIIEGLLPSTRSVTIRGKRKHGMVWHGKRRHGGNSNTAMGGYSLLSCYKGNPVYVSNMAHIKQKRGHGMAGWLSRAGSICIKWRMSGLSVVSNVLHPTLTLHVGM